MRRGQYFDWGTPTSRCDDIQKSHTADFNRSQSSKTPDGQEIQKDFIHLTGHFGAKLVWAEHWTAQCQSQTKATCYYNEAMKGRFYLHWVQGTMYSQSWTDRKTVSQAPTLQILSSGDGWKWTIPGEQAPSTGRPKTPNSTIKVLTFRR